MYVSKLETLAWKIKIQRHIRIIRLYLFLFEHSSMEIFKTPVSSISASLSFSKPVIGVVRNFSPPHQKSLQGFMLFFRKSFVLLLRVFQWLCFFTVKLLCCVFVLFVCSGTNILLQLMLHLSFSYNSMWVEAESSWCSILGACMHIAGGCGRSIVVHAVFIFLCEGIHWAPTLCVSVAPNCSVLYFCWGGAQGWGRLALRFRRGGRAQLQLGGGISVILLVLFMLTSCRLVRLS